MNSLVKQMLSRTHSDSRQEREEDLKEVLQEIILSGLARTDFFSKAAFYGGTALRLFYGLDRFSEDMDFSLKLPDSRFDLVPYLDVIEETLNEFGLSFEANLKKKQSVSPIQSAFVKGNTRSVMLEIYGQEIAQTIARSDALKIKLEIDTNPPDGAQFERKVKLRPVPHFVTLYDEPSLFAGKLHAILCRSWKNRVKGRDLYDFVFYRRRGTPVNLDHLRNRLIDSGAIDKTTTWNLTILIEKLKLHFSRIDYESAKKDVLAFIEGKSVEQLALWDADFFSQIVDGIEETAKGK